MALPTSNIYYALNDRAINLLIKGKTDTNAVIGGTDEPTFSDAEISGLLEHGQEVLITVVRNNETRPGGAFFPYRNNTTYDLDKYGIFKTGDRNNYKRDCLYLTLQAGGSSDIKLQELIFISRNRAIHECDLSNVCLTLGTNIELIPIRNDGESCGVEHYTKSPYIEFNEDIS